jgi:hypothetical protein
METTHPSIIEIGKTSETALQRFLVGNSQIDELVPDGAISQQDITLLCGAAGQGRSSAAFRIAIQAAEDAKEMGFGPVIIICVNSWEPAAVIKALARLGAPESLFSHIRVASVTTISELVFVVAQESTRLLSEGTALAGANLHAGTCRGCGVGGPTVLSDRSTQFDFEHGALNFFLHQQLAARFWPWYNFNFRANLVPCGRGAILSDLTRTFHTNLLSYESAS